MGPAARRTLALAAIVAAVVAAFSPAFSAGFLYWDDDKNFLENAMWRGLSPEHLRWMATTFRGGPYQPLSWLSLAVDHALFGMDPRGYHAVNVALHAGTAVAFFFLARRFLAQEAAALAAALFFAVHPLRVESVAWITERRDVLSGLFYVLSILAYVHVEPEDRGRRRTVLLALSLVSFLLGLLAKASGMTLPLVLLLLDRWPLRRGGRITLLEKVPFAALALLFAVLAWHGQASLPHELRGIGEHGFGARLAQAGYAAVFYPAKTLVPARLSPIYELPLPFDATEIRFVAAAMIAAAATAAAGLARRTLPAAWTAWAAFLAILAPVSGLVQAGPQLVADRYSYLSCMPFALLAAAALFASFPRAAPALALAAVAALGALTWRQTRLWRDTETLFAYALEIDERSPIAHDVVGRMLAMRGEPEEAARHYRRSIEIAPDRPIPHNNLGLLRLQQGRIDEAILEFQAALRAEDDYARARTNLGAALLKHGEPAEAERVLREAVRRDPRDAGARTNLAQALIAQNRLDEAIAELRNALASNPSLAEAHEGLAQAYAKLGRGDLAEEHRRAAARLRSAP